METSAERDGVQPNQQSYFLALSGVVALGDGGAVQQIVLRMLERLQEHPTAAHANFVAESWCLAGKTRRAQRFLDSLDTTSLCQVRQADGATCRCLTRKNEESHALLAAGWAAAGEGERAAEVMIGMAVAGLDPNKVDLNSIVDHWRKGKRRRCALGAPASSRAPRLSIVRVQHAIPGLVTSACPSCRSTLGHEIALPELSGARQSPSSPPERPHAGPRGGSRMPAPSAQRQWGVSADTPDPGLLTESRPRAHEGECRPATHPAVGAATS